MTTSRRCLRSLLAKSKGVIAPLYVTTLQYQGQIVAERYWIIRYIIFGICPAKFSEYTRKLDVCITHLHIKTKFRCSIYNVVDKY